ncbi:MAG: hypothetical protein QOF48_3870 [Verrucomicrobiota bacterium]
MKRIENRTQRKTRTRYAASARFELPAAPAAPFRGALETDLEQLKGQLLRELLAGAPDPKLNASLRRAASDAAALAWTTAFPLLVLPELVREKAESARRYVRRQALVLKRSRETSKASLDISCTLRGSKRDSGRSVGR